MDEMKPEKEDISKKVDIKTETSTTVLPGGEKTKTTVTTKTTEEGVEKTTLISTYREDEPSKTFSTGEDGSVTEHVVLEKKTTAVVQETEEFKGDKQDLLQKLGEELGKLDEQLEEKFKEKRKTEEPEGKNELNGRTLLLLSLLG